MLSLVRIVIIALLSVAVPLQASVSYARVVGMATGNAAGSTTPGAGVAAAVINAGQSGDTLAARASSAEHHHHLRNLPAQAGKQAVKAAGHHASHPPGNACDNCAKCCLAGAAAPPLIWPQAADVIAARVLFSASSDTSSCFIPDGPERPPRCL